MAKRIIEISPTDRLELFFQVDDGSLDINHNGNKIGKLKGSKTDIDEIQTFRIAEKSVTVHYIRKFWLYNTVTVFIDKEQVAQYEFTRGKESHLLSGNCNSLND